MSAETGPILVFDGICVLCSHSVQFVLRHDREKRYRFATTQSDSGRSLLIAHGLDPHRPLSVLLVDHGVACTESMAMLRVLDGFGGAWKALALCLRIIPRFLRDPVYRWVARHRYRWFGQRQTCYLPPMEDAQRFLP
ncbi:MAG: thiol-disulfide oxidoreductase DCC family protein [Rudaea sp.]|nr:thiol-disulfide oxidoreductase DCC family protein [Rudaea sp.]